MMAMHPLPFEISHVPIVVGTMTPCPMLACATKTNASAGRAANHFCEFVGRNEAMYADEWRCVCGYRTFGNSDESKLMREQMIAEGRIE